MSHQKLSKKETSWHGLSNARLQLDCKTEKIKLETQIEFKVPRMQKTSPDFAQLGEERALFLNRDNGTKGQDGPGGDCRGSRGHGRHRALSAAGSGETVSLSRAQCAVSLPRHQVGRHRPGPRAGHDAAACATTSWPTSSPSRPPKYTGFPFPLKTNLILRRRWPAGS